MNPQPIATPSHGLDLGDIYYVLFRHKWKIVLCSLAGLLAAGAMYRSEAPPYQSEAKLLVRYIISESKTTGPTTGNSPAKISPDERGTTIMNTEMEILNSMNLAAQVVDTLGAEKILAKAGGGTDTVAAAVMIRQNLRVSVGQASSVIHVTFRHPDAEMVTTILREVVDRYLKMHVEAHRATGMLGEALAAEADTLRSKLNQTDEELRRAIARAGAISPEIAKEGMSNQMVSIRREIQNYESELAARLAVFEELKKRQSTSVSEPIKNDAVPEVPPSVLDEFRTVYGQLTRFQSVEQELLLQFTPENVRVKEIQARRTEAEQKVAKMREQHPGLLKVSTPTDMRDPAAQQAMEISTAWIQITSYQAKIKELNAQVDRIRADMARLDREEGPINELKRNKELQDQHYRYYQAALEQSRINQTLGDGKVSNITQIQTPSPPFRAEMDMRKIGLTALIGIFAGFAWAFLVEMYFDRSVRRPKDLQRLMRVPLLLSIPRLRPRDLALRLETPAQPALTSGNNGSGHAIVAAAPQPVRFGRIDALQPFHETLRDRLIGYFENRNLTHKPKLVAVTGLRRGAGVTTTAAGLARSLSETGEGNVLLVDMTAEQGSAQQFNKGKPVCGLDEALETRSQALVTENLYVVSEGSNSDRLSRNLPQRFTRLVPKLKASDFDYIIFDMPAVNQLSITPRLAGFMDIVMMVVESEKTDREMVEGACAMLAESKAHVGIVLNKTRNYVPNGLQQQLNAV
jgi:succinoglycan biosynthesis transport protein ExoP